MNAQDYLALLVLVIGCVVAIAFSLNELIETKEGSITAGPLVLMFVSACFVLILVIHSLVIGEPSWILS